MSLIVELCSEIVSLNTALGLDLKSMLLPGSSLDVIKSVEESLPFAFPESVREMYGWSEGLRDDATMGCEIIPGYEFESLQASAEMFHLLSEAKDFPRFHKGDKWWFPVFHGGGTDFYGVTCYSESRHDGLVVHDMSDADPFPAFASLESMLMTVRDAYRSRIYYVGADGLLDFGVATFHTNGHLAGQLKSVDISAFKAIARKYNPGIPCWMD